MYPLYFRSCLVAAFVVSLTSSEQSCGSASVRSELVLFAPTAESREHPEPRDDVSARDVSVTPELSPEVSRVFHMVAEIPQVVDGIRCPCDCASNPGHYSLLSCFGRHQMAATCGICLDAARLVHRLHSRGHDLSTIRRAIDETFPTRTRRAAGLVDRHEKLS